MLAWGGIVLHLLSGNNISVLHYPRLLGLDELLQEHAKLGLEILERLAGDVISTNNMLVSMNLHNRDIGDIAAFPNACRNEQCTILVSSTRAAPAAFATIRTAPKLHVNMGNEWWPLAIQQGHDLANAVGVEHLRPF